MYAAMRCAYLIDVKFINTEQAIIMLEITSKTRETVDSVLHNLGWTARTRSARAQSPTCLRPVGARRRCDKESTDLATIDLRTTVARRLNFIAAAVRFRLGLLLLNSYPALLQ